MKKRLLITSIVMMLVVAVALSTATYAWFTSNASVSASTVTLTAAVNTEASIGISWANSGFASELTVASPASGTYFVPTAISTATTNDAFASTIWSSATVRNESGGPTFNDQHRTGITSNDITGNTFESVVGDNGYTNLMAYTYTNGSDSTTIYINNGSTTNTLSSVVAKVAITGAAKDFIRVAIFRNDGTEGAFRLKGIMADRYTYTAATGTAVEGTDYYDADGAKQTVTVGDDVTSFFTRTDATGNSSTAVGTITTDHLVATDITATNTAYSINCGEMTAASTMQLKVVVWMDGTLLTDATAGTAVARKNASIDLTFDAAR